VLGARTPRQAAFEAYDNHDVRDALHGVDPIQAPGDEAKHSLKQLLDFLADRDAHHGPEVATCARTLGGHGEPHRSQLVEEDRSVILFDQERLVTDRVPRPPGPVKNSKRAEERLSRQLLLKLR